MGGGGGRWGTSLTLSWEYTARSTPVLHIMTINIPKKSCVRISRKPVNHSSTENIKKPSYNLYCLSERRMVNGRKFSLETLYSGQFTLKLLPTLKGRKNRFFFYLTKKFNLTFPLKKNFLKFSEAPKWFSETYFQIKVNKSGRCHNIGPGWIPGGIFAATAHLRARFHVIYLFCLHRALVEALCLWKNQTRKIVLIKKRGRRKKSGPEKTERVPLCQDKKKNLYESD